MLLPYLKTYLDTLWVPLQSVGLESALCETMILSSMTACDATAMTLPLYSVNLLLSSVHPSLKQ